MQRVGPGQEKPGSVPSGAWHEYKTGYCRDCYEVDGPVISRLQENLGDWRDVTVSLGKDKYLLDLQSTNKALLRKAGVKEQNITDSRLCTRCNSELFYSYRREGKDAGSLAALMQIIGSEI